MQIYIHTIDGKPAMFDGDQICFARHYGPGNKPCYSLKEIRRQQEATFKYREERGYTYKVGEYGYIRYRIKEE